MKTLNSARVLRGTVCLEKILGRLNKVKSTGHSSWKASCPAHDDKNPSLSITESNNGIVLIKCWAGCSAAEIVASIGLRLSDLFPSTRRCHGRPLRSKPSLQAVAVERGIVELGNKLMGPLKEDDLHRYVLARSRLEGLQ